MVSQTATSLSDTLRQKVESIEQGAAGLSDDAARMSPAEGEWSVAEVLSHLCGEDSQAFLSTVTRFVKEDKPQIDVVPGISHFEARQNARVADLLGAFRAQYDEIVRYLVSLDDAQLKRTAHVPLLKETPFGEQPTLEQWVGTLSEFHLGGHIAQIADIRQKIGA